MNSTIEYDIISADNVGDLISAVTTAIQDGWEPLGGAVIFPGGFKCHQTMTRILQQP